MSDHGYYTALVCRRGHVATSCLELSPEAKAPYCGECGCQTMSTCDNCRAAIRGPALDGYGIGYSPPSYCPQCGQAYPWTEAKLQAGHELIGELDDLTEAQKKTLIESFDDLTVETPRTQVAAVRFGKLTSAIKSQPMKDAVYRLLIDVASETAKKVLTSM